MPIEPFGLGQFDFGIDQPLSDQPFQGPAQVSVPSIAIGGDDISGASSSNAIAAAIEQIEEFASEGGGLLAVVYGEHIIAGMVNGRPRLRSIMQVRVRA
jgi:hypothetical protein